MKRLLISLVMFVYILSILEIPRISSFRLYDNPLTVFDPAQAGTITVTGYWLYWFNTTYLLPITRARVEIYDEETTGTVYLGSTYTDYSGYFTFGPISNDDGPGEDGLDIIVTVNATSSAARVITPGGIVYSARTSTFRDCPDGTFPIGYIATPYAQRGAWWIFSYHFGLTRGWYYLSTTVGYNTPTATARWPFETWPHYHLGGEIHLPDWAAWWPDIIVHEHGHHVMYSLYGYIPPSMEDHWFSTRSNSTTAWAEGWADFFPLVVFNDPVFTWSNGTHYANINLETPHWCSAGWDDGDRVEGRVAGALWDIFDSTNDGYDVLSLGFPRIWNILSSQTDNTFREFWDAWNASYPHPKSGSQLQEWTNTLMAIFQNSIDYRGPGDANADGIVNILDINLAAAAFGAEKGDPKWDQRADMVTPWDLINILDILYISVRFGHTYDC